MSTKDIKRIAELNKALKINFPESKYPVYAGIGWTQGVFVKSALKGTLINGKKKWITFDPAAMIHDRDMRRYHFGTKKFSTVKNNSTKKVHDAVDNKLRNNINTIWDNWKYKLDGPSQNLCRKRADGLIGPVTKFNKIGLSKFKKFQTTASYFKNDYEGKKVSTKLVDQYVAMTSLYWRWWDNKKFNSIIPHGYRSPSSYLNSCLLRRKYALSLLKKIHSQKQKLDLVKGLKIDRTERNRLIKGLEKFLKDVFPYENWTNMGIRKLIRKV